MFDDKLQVRERKRTRETREGEREREKWSDWTLARTR